MGNSISLGGVGILRNILKKYTMTPTSAATLMA